MLEKDLLLLEGAPSVSAVRAWNALPNNLSEAADPGHFKTMVKNHLLHVYFTQAS